MINMNTGFIEVIIWPMYRVEFTKPYTLYLVNGNSGDSVSLDAENNTNVLLLFWS